MRWLNITNDSKLKGAGGGVDDPGKVKIEFSVVPDRGECQLPDHRCFLPDQKILFLAEVIGFWNLENMGT